MAIKNGTKVVEGQYPYQASLHLKDVKILKAVVGMNKLDDKNAVTYEIEKIIKHELFMENIYEPKFADIALVRVSKDIKFNDKVQPIQLASSENIEDYPFEGISVTITGWGNTHLCMSDFEENTNSLFVAHQTIYDFEKCEEDYTVYHKSKHSMLSHVSLVNCGMMCTVGHEYTCKGDSGGPVVTGRGIQVGIVSFGMKSLPEVSTNVWTWYEWIIENSNITNNNLYL
ncbi:hypothetical protein TKK_0012369 [Trichogramma kaykai]|uniref:Peptidase S1 domain-containing protein n=1 Tax=Trichogramma kaykai TaxID=54128 RepID=A0ABD2WP37_9HYME